LVLLNYLKYDNLSLISHHGLIKKESNGVLYIFHSEISYPDAVVSKERDDDILIGFRVLVKSK